MPWERPTLTEIKERMRTDMVTQLGGAGSLLRRSVIAVLVNVVAGAIHLVYGFLEFISLQFFVSTAETDYLERKAAEFGVTRKSATKAIGNGDTGASTDGTNIPAGTEYQSAAGTLYETLTATLVNGTSANLDIQAKDAGAAGNDLAGVVLTITSPLAGVSDSLTIGSLGIYNGTDDETDDALRARAEQKIRNPLHGGTAIDLVNWALEVSGVTRAWAIPSYQGVGTVAVLFMRDNDPSPYPNSAQCTAVRNYILNHTDPLTGIAVGLPVTGEPGLFVLSPMPVAIDFSIRVSPNSAAIQSAILDALDTFVYEEGGPGQVIYLSRLSEIISGIGGEDHHLIVAPAADVVVQNTEILQLGSVSFADY